MVGDRCVVKDVSGDPDHTLNGTEVTIVDYDHGRLGNLVRLNDGFEHPWSLREFWLGDDKLDLLGPSKSTVEMRQELEEQLVELRKEIA